MELMKLLKERYSTRRFDSREVPEEIVEKILEAARVAPTAHNKQAFHIYNLKGDGVGEMIGQFTRMNYHAPVNLALTVNKNKSWKRSDGYDLADIDAGIIGTHIILMAEEVGLGSCWVADFDADKAEKLLNLPEDEKIVTVFEIGYKASNDRPSALHSKRKTLEELVTKIEF